MYYKITNKFLKIKTLYTKKIKNLALTNSYNTIEICTLPQQICALGIAEKHLCS